MLDFVDADGATGGANNVLTKRYLWGQAVDQILAEETPGGATVWDLADNLGSVRDQMTHAGAIISGSHVSFDAFGKILTGTPATRFAFTGQEWDADAGLYYYNARWYNPVTGEFVSEDPIGFKAGDANLGRYVNNSPTIAVDPTGLVESESDQSVPKYVQMLEGWFPVGTYNAKFVAKSFIDGVPDVGTIWPPRPRVPLPPLSELEDDIYSPELSNSDDRLKAFSKFATTFFEAFNQDPDTDAKDGKYRLFTRVDVKFVCCGDEITTYKVRSQKEGGYEGPPSIYGTMAMDGGQTPPGNGGPAVSASPNEINIKWRGYGRPNWLAEPLMQWVAVRTSRYIWHRVTVRLYCENGVGHHQVNTFTGSGFPSHRLWVNGQLAKDIEQGPLSNLWNPSSTYGKDFVE